MGYVPRLGVHGGDRYPPHAKPAAGESLAVADALTSSEALLTHIAVALVLVWALIGCASIPERMDREAAHLGLTRSEVKGHPFRHVVYQKLKPIPDSVLHVYLEGDGSPWIQERWVADDPTPRNPLMLRLMALDSVDSIYVGRPCYHGLARTPPCAPRFWTSARYSREVVDSMASVVRRILEQRGSARLGLFGHSGGGTLAMLMAEELTSTGAVVTLAGNLDVEAWARYHRYTPLLESLDPVRRPPLPRTVRQLHVIGSDDRVILPEFLAEAARRGVVYNVVELEGFTHSCCWEAIWPDILRWAEGGAFAPSSSGRLLDASKAGDGL
ncbi:MAG: alpha/beta fold hydrolase [Gammaproteobacteria bacterium]